MCCLALKGLVVKMIMMTTMMAVMAMMISMYYNIPVIVCYFVLGICSKLFSSDIREDLVSLRYLCLCPFLWLGSESITYPQCWALVDCEYHMGSY